MIRTTLLAIAAAGTLLLGNLATSGSAEASHRVGVFIGIGSGHFIHPQIVIGQHRHKHCHVILVKKKGKKKKVAITTCHRHWHHHGHH